MSGPVRSEDVPPTTGAPAVPTPTAVEVTESHEAEVGATRVLRALPRRSRRTIGAWCFADHMTPSTVSAAGGGLDIGPHPHIGLQTVTWLAAGELLHTDSVGSEQLIRPGQLNLMTAGRGVAHAEQTPRSFRGPVHGMQLWVALPERTRHDDPAFEHHAELPGVELDRSTATVLIGSFAGAESPARRDTDHLGVELLLRPGASTVPLTAAHEHGLVVMEGRSRSRVTTANR
jgi:redox-sensitive bicupin YhaK (pirin superfamily)